MKYAQTPWDHAPDPFRSFAWRLIATSVPVGFVGGVVFAVAAHIPAGEQTDSLLAIRVIRYGVALPCALLALRGALAADFNFRKEPDPSPLRPPESVIPGAGRPPRLPCPRIPSMSGLATSSANSSTK
jgi:hypothetical protein